jgi:Fur family zinc uptake transcriptional regulator
MTITGFTDHDHRACISGALSAAEAHCAAEGLNFTPVRRRALEILLTEHKALGAYDLLSQLARDGLGSQPPVAYRALDFLVKHGFAHKVECLNAFIACTHPGQDHAPAFLICRRCNAVAEAPAAPAARVFGAAGPEGFVIEQTVLEAEGLCAACAARPA